MKTILLTISLAILLTSCSSEIKWKFKGYNEAFWDKVNAQIEAYKDLPEEDKEMIQKANEKEWEEIDK
tara:strand:+ start:35991 stop:36194 length:204 start_codon:yes stop_codon:yes gene_type:complete